jgi:hypothetical protein
VYEVDFCYNNILAVIELENENIDDIEDIDEKLIYKR